MSSAARAAAFALVMATAVVAHARPTDVNGANLHKYAASDTVEHYDTTRFRIFFTQSGTNAVPAGDANTNGVPDHVESVGQLYEDVLDFYLSHKFLQPLGDAGLPNNGGDGRFDVYLLDFAGSADGQFVREQCSNGTCQGYMVQENDFVGYSYPSVTVGNRVLASHEFFHAVQAAYSADQDSVVSEGTAEWAEIQFDPTNAFDLAGMSGGYLSMADHSIDRPGAGPVPAFSYGMGLFFEFLSEKLTPDLIRILWEDLKAGARGVPQQTWLPGLVALLPREYSQTFPDTFVTFAQWNLFTKNRADPKRAYADGADYAGVAMTNGTLPYEDDALRVFYASQQVLAFDPAGRSQLTAIVLPAAGLGADSLAPLRIVIAPVTSGNIGNLSTRPSTDDSTAVSIGDATQMLVSLVQTNTSGDSVRGILCVGTPDEVNACKAKNGATGDMGTMPPMDGGGCAIAGKPAQPCWVALLGLGALFALRAVAVRDAMKAFAALSVLALAACHAAVPTTAATPPTRTVQLRMAQGAHRGKLVLGWLNAEQAQRWAKHSVKAQDFVDLVSRFEVIGDTTLDEQVRPFSSHLPAEAAAIVAVLDPGGRFWYPLFGHGGFLGTGPIDQAISISELPPQQRPPCEGPRMQAIIIEAPQTAGSIGNDPERRFCAWLPKSYGSTPEKRYPVVFLLPGFGSNEMAYLVGGNALGPIADKIAEETGKEVLLVGVDTSTKTGSTYLVDSPITGNFDRFMAVDALGVLNHMLRIVAGREHRALLGHSTGGFNAISFGLRHPELFSAIAASSPDGLDLDAWLSEGGKPRRWIFDWMKLDAQVGAPGQLWSYAADWSPGAGQPEWPFDLHSGNKTPAFARWHARSPMTLLDGASRFTDRIFVSVGDRDEFGLTQPALAFAEALRQRGAQPTVLVTPNAGHFDGQRDRLERGLRYLVDRIAR